MIKAIVFDLDDTLMPEADYVKSGFRAIGAAFGEALLADKLWQLFKENRQNVYQRAGFSKTECEKCIEIYRSHKPDITLSSSTVQLLAELKQRGIRLGIITDGRPLGQRNKIYALGLDKIMDKIIITDELGGERFRKPHRKAFELMRESLNVEFDEMMYVGDNPAKDFYIGSIYPITTVRLVGSGIYKKEAYLKDVKEKKLIRDICEISEVL